MHGALAVALLVGIARALIAFLQLGSAGPCASVWLYGTVAGYKQRNVALAAISKAEGMVGSKVELYSSTLLSRDGNDVRELCTVNLDSHRLKYEVAFSYVPGSGCEPPFRGVTVRP